MKLSIKEQIKIRIKEKRAEYKRKRKKKFLYLKHKGLLGNYYRNKHTKIEKAEVPKIEKLEVKIIKEPLIKKLIKSIIKLCTSTFAIFVKRKSSKKILPEE